MRVRGKLVFPFQRTNVNSCFRNRVSQAAEIAAAASTSSVEGSGLALAPSLDGIWATKQVIVFRCVANTVGPVSAGAQLSQNHWTIYCLVQEIYTAKHEAHPEPFE